MTFINPWETKNGSHQEVRLQHPHISYEYAAALSILYIQVRIPVVHDIAWPYAIDLWLLLTHHYQLHTATCSSYHKRVACSKYVFLQAKMSFCTWLLLTHHYQLHTATCSSYHDQFACSKCASLQAKMFFCKWLLLTHHYQLHTATSYCHM